MLRSLLWLAKTALFALTVLIVASLIHVRGRTVSDQVEIQVSQARRSKPVRNFENWADDLIHNRKEGANRAADASDPTPSDKSELRSLLKR